MIDTDLSDVILQLAFFHELGVIFLALAHDEICSINFPSCREHIVFRYINTLQSTHFLLTEV